MKRTLEILISMTMILTLIPMVTFADSESGSLFNFKRTLIYNQGRFSDVKNSDWFADNVAAAYEYQLINGTSATSYEPNSNITIAQTITLAARLHRMYYGEGEMVITGWNDPWYQPYVDYAVEKGIINSWEYSESYNNNASRRRFAYIMASSLPPEAFTKINNIDMGQIPDMESENEFAQAVYQLYNAGILTGNDEYGTFLPNSYIRRSEVAAIATRIADPTLRKTFELKEYVPIRTYQEVYSDVVREYEQHYGTAGFVTGDGKRGSHVNGVYYLNLQDLNRDGIPELIIGYGNDYEQKLTVWEYVEGEAICHDLRYGYLKDYDGSRIIYTAFGAGDNSYLIVGNEDLDGEVLTYGYFDEKFDVKKGFYRISSEGYEEVKFDNGIKSSGRLAYIICGKIDEEYVRCTTRLETASTKYELLMYK